MTDAELFDQFTKPHGGRLPKEAIPPDRWDSSYGIILDMANGLIADARRLVPGLPPIYFDFVHNPSINAFAFKAEGKYFIGFHTGTRYMLEVLFGRMLSDHRLFEFVASPALEDNTLPPLVYKPHAEDMNKAGVRPMRPKSTERWSYMSSLLRRAFFFLIGHEIAHITLGHIDYMISKTGNPVFPELAWNLPSQEKDLERQAMEIEADRRSVSSSMMSAKLTHEAPSTTVAIETLAP